MKVSVEKKEQTVTVYRGDIESAKALGGKWEDLTGSVETPFAVEHEGQQWKLLEDLEDIKTAPPGECDFWKKTDFEIGKFTGVPLDPIEDEKLAKKHSGYVKIKGQVLPDTNFGKIKLEKIKKVITGWDVINNDTGEPVQCTDELKEIVYLCNPEIIDDAMIKFGVLGRDGGYSNREVELKN